MREFPWGDHQAEGPLAVAFGEREVYILREGPRWDYGWRDADGEAPNAPVVRRIERAPAELALKSAFSAADDGRFRLEPLFPGRPLLFYLDEPLRVLPGAQVKLRLELPLVASILDSAGATIAEVPLFRPSATWRGDTDDGFLCYAVRIGVAQALGAEETPRRDRAGCEVAVRNAGKTPVELGSILVRTDGLGMRERAERLLADPVELLLGPEGGQHARPAPLPARPGDGEVFGPARRGAREGLARAGASIMKSIKGA